MRELRYLLTNQCNYECYFCHLEGQDNVIIPNKEILTPDDYVFLFSVFKQKTGCNTITLTGGEPLLKNNIEEIVQKLYENGAEITIVTNGSLINKYNNLYNYVKRLNISLHTLNQNIYKRITSKGSVENIVNNISFIKTNFPNVEIRLNVAIAKSLNFSKDSINKIIDFSDINNLSIKFIELYPTTLDDYVSLNEVEDILLEDPHIIKLKQGDLNQKHFIKNNKTNIYFTQIFCTKATIQNECSKCEYCKKYQDFFITPTGGVKLCMNTFNTFSLKNNIKSRNTIMLEKAIDYIINNLLGNCYE